MRGKLGRAAERLATVDELIAAIMETNALAKRLAVQDPHHALRHEKINSLLCEWECARMMMPR